MAGDNKTEQATPRRRQKAREKGQVARSRELSEAIVLIAVVFALWGFPQTYAVQWRDFFKGLVAVAISGDISDSVSLFQQTGGLVFRWSAPFMLTAWAVALFATVVQGGLVVAPAALSPDLGRLNPVANLKKLFSLSAFSRLLKSLLPAAVLVYISATLVARDWDALLGSAHLGARQVLLGVLARLFEICWKSALTLAIWAAADYAFTRWSFERSLRMTKEEVRDEMKQTDGNPQVRARIRRLMRQARRRRILADVAKATVVVTNPTHYAIALEYKPEAMAAPRVVAKGMDRLAHEIREIARWHDVPIVENPPLAQALYRVAEVGQAIPAKLYQAVAEILAFIYRAQMQMAASRGRG